MGTAGGWTEEVIAARTDCASPPCAVGTFTGINELILISLVFLCDFYLTRGFSRGMHAQMQLVRASVSVSQTVAVLLSRYATDEAWELLEGEEGRQLPDELRKAYRQLLLNLVNA